MVRDKAMLLEAGASNNAVFITTLSDTNIEENPRINVRMSYGQRESALVKVIEGNYPMLPDNSRDNGRLYYLFYLQSDI